MQKNGLEFERPGSSKDIYSCDRDSIGFDFTNHYSVFDVGRAQDQIPDKGAAICACAVKSFKIAEAIGVPTHFIEQIGPTMIRVKKANIISDRYLLRTDENYVAPDEFIYRLRVAGSIDRDFREGKKKPEDYGLSAGEIPKVGTPFPYPVHMFTTKFEKLDREITEEEACLLSGFTLKDMYEYWSMIDRLTGAIALELKKADLLLFDGKVECLMGKRRQKLIGDVFGTPDEDRFCKIIDGKIEHYSKEYIREIHIESGYFNSLKLSRRIKKRDIPIPKLTEEQIAEISRRYELAAKAYAPEYYQKAA